MEMEMEPMDLGFKYSDWPLGHFYSTRYCTE